MRSIGQDPVQNGPQAIIDSLEELCRAAEVALCALDWSSLGRIAAEQRRLTHALDRAFVDAPPAGAERAALLQRLRAVGSCRADQLSRLESYHEEVGGRLKIIARWRSAMTRMRNPNQRRVSTIIDGAG